MVGLIYELIDSVVGDGKRYGWQDHQVRFYFMQYKLFLPSNALNGWKTTYRLIIWGVFFFFCSDYIFYDMSATMSEIWLLPHSPLPSRSQTVATSRDLDHWARSKNDV